MDSSVDSSIFAPVQSDLDDNLDQGSDFNLGESDEFDINDSAMISDQMNKLSGDLDVLTLDIQNIVIANFDCLIDQEEKIEELQLKAIGVQRRVEALLASVESLRNKFSEPFNKIAHRIVLLNRLKATCDLLRKIIRVIHLSKRLEQNNLFDSETPSQPREMIKTAQHVSELEALLASDDNLLKIAIIQHDIELVRQNSEKIKTVSEDMLVAGISAQGKKGGLIEFIHSLIAMFV